MKKLEPSLDATVITPEIKTFVEEEMREDDETTAEQLHSLLTLRGFRISKKTILRCRTDLSWTFRGSAYCHSVNSYASPTNRRLKRLQWTRDHLQNNQFRICDLD